MKVLVLGSGGREHAICWRLSQDPSCEKVFAWPGNAGMDFLPSALRAKYVALDTAYDEAAFEKTLEQHHIDLVIPGAEKYLYEGVADWCARLKVPCLAPSKAAARLEESKLFAKEIMLKAHVPTAHYADLTAAFRQDLTQAGEILSQFKRPVIKISGPSLGKGVFVCQDHSEAMQTLQSIKSAEMPGIEEGIFVEEALDGREVSLFFACNGESHIYLGAAQDHKRLLDHDEGPNTGGMGAISPVSWVDEKFVQETIDVFLLPTLKTMQHMGTPFKGVLFLGLMVGDQGPQLLEYNVRFGDPETQVILPLLEGDLTALLHKLVATTDGSIMPPKTLDKVAIHVVKAAKGYPGNFGTQVEKGQRITANVSPQDDTIFFFAGVKNQQGNLYTNGGRVLGVTCLAPNKQAARELVYNKLHQLSFDGEQFRRDIGERT